MEKALNIIYLFGSLMTLILFLYFVFNKFKLHFELIKIIYPNMFPEVISYFNFEMSYKIFRLEFSEIIWMWTPVFYKKKLSTDLTEELLVVERKLIKNNMYIFIAFTAYLFWLFVIAYLFFS
jgi:hypothetical protein